MIKKLFNDPHVLYQSVKDDTDLPESAIAIHVDNAGLICLSQENREIVLNKASVPELCKLLMQITKGSR